MRMIKPSSPILKGEDVRSVQQLLALRGYPPADGRIDGQYGTNSQNAARAFQKARGLQQDAWVGDHTLGALLNG